MYRMKSGKVFSYNQKNDILVSPFQKDLAKKIGCSNPKLFWKLINFFDTEYSENDLKTFLVKNAMSNEDMDSIFDFLIKQNLVFSLDSEDEVLVRNKRNIYSLGIYDNDTNTVDFYKKICNMNLLVIGAGTVGSNLAVHLFKYGNENLHIVDGDVVSIENITAQLPFNYDDIGENKASSLKMKLNSEFVKDYPFFVDESNIIDIMHNQKIDVVFCCADDATGNMQKMLINICMSEKKPLLIAGYSLETIIVHLVNELNYQSILDEIDEAAESNENFLTIAANTGTIYKGSMSASLMLSLFIQNFLFPLKCTHQIYYDIYSNKGYSKKSPTVNLKYVGSNNMILDISKQVNYIENYFTQYLSGKISYHFIMEIIYPLYYYYYIMSLSYSDDKEFTQALQYYENKILQMSAFDKNISSKDIIIKKENKEEIDTFEKMLYGFCYGETGSNVMAIYRKHVNNIDDVINIYNCWETFVLKNIKSSYLQLTTRKFENFNSKYNSLNNFIIENYSINFELEGMLSKINKATHFFYRNNHKFAAIFSTTDSYEQLKNEFVDKSNEHIDFNDAMLTIKNHSESSKQRDFVECLLQNNWIDYSQRRNKTAKSLTIFNPFLKESRIFLTYCNDYNSLLTLSHEVYHAYYYDVLSEKIDLETLAKTPTSFWEVFAKIGEWKTIISLRTEEKHEFISLQHHNFFYFSQFLNMEHDELKHWENNQTIDFDTILEIREKGVLNFTDAPEKLKYTKYNFIYYKPLYSKSFSSIDYILSEIISFNLINYFSNNNNSEELFESELLLCKAYDMTFFIKFLNMTIEEMLDNYIKYIFANNEGEYFYDTNERKV